VRALFTTLIALVIVGGFLVYMCSFTVRFTEAAVVTTFGQADAEDVITEPGLRFKWPAPIQSTTVYDVRSRFLQTRSETQQTADDRQIVVEAFLAWRVKDPLLFYQRFRGSSGTSAREHYDNAQKQLTDLLRSAMSEVSKYRLGDLFAADIEQSRLAQLEKDILTRLREPPARGGSNVEQYGVDVVIVGINSVVLPEETTKQVFERMRENRKRLAAKAESEGQALATAIRSEAENSAKRIREFAKYRADQIRNRGDEEAAPYFKALQEDPDLAVFLNELQLLREGFGRQTTLVLPQSMALPGVRLFSPEVRGLAREGRLPPPIDGSTSSGAGTGPSSQGANP